MCVCVLFRVVAMNHVPKVGDHGLSCHGLVHLPAEAWVPRETERF